MVASTTQQEPKVSKKQKPKVFKRQKNAKVCKRKGKKKDPKKEKREKLVLGEQVEQCPLVPVTLKEFLPLEFQSLELQTYFDKRR